MDEAKTTHGRRRISASGLPLHGELGGLEQRSELLGRERAHARVRGDPVPGQQRHHADGAENHGVRKYGTVTLKRGVVSLESGFWEWWNAVQSGSVDRRNLTVSLLNERHEPVMIWEIQPAWPVKVERSSLNAKGNEIAVETLELATRASRSQRSKRPCRGPTPPAWTPVPSHRGQAVDRNECTSSAWRRRPRTTTMAARTAWALLRAR